jgi:DNA-binding transcriptional LysR family regulator
MENVADFGLTQLPIAEKRVQVVDIYRDEIRAVLPARHPLGENKSITCQQLAEHPLLLPKSGTTRTRLDHWFEPVEEKMKVSMELDSTEMMKRFVVAGLGSSFLAVSNCREEIASGKIRAVPLAPEPMWRKLGLIYRKDKALSKAALGFIHVMLEHFGDQTGSREPVSSPRVANG